MAEVELHDEIADWAAGLSDDEWNRAVVVIDRLSELGASARMPLSRSLGDGLFELRLALEPRRDGSPTGSRRTGASSCSPPSANNATTNDTRSIEHAKHHRLREAIPLKEI